MGPHGGAGTGTMQWGAAGGAGFGLLWWLVLLAIALALVVGAVYLVHRLDASATTEQDAVDVLRSRYASGEIDDEEFERRRTRLDGGPSA
ncbi:SHOCT domain-containing protein [Salinigranum marinum]|uniref:SHOCT domain-containing protein n=1 Tax=Salinigranum marinum TaxID=1515595 RepID=UPI002989DD9D|nr:SHOCT domain-containing protein [Salinigranum marinum]